MGKISKSVHGMTICRLLVSLVMPKGDPWDRFFYPHIMDYYIGPVKNCERKIERDPLCVKTNNVLYVPSDEPDDTD